MSSIAGTLTDSKNLPVRDGSVRVYDRTTYQLLGEAVCDSLGRFVADLPSVDAGRICFLIGLYVGQTVTEDRIAALDRQVTVERAGIETLVSLRFRDRITGSNVHLYFTQPAILTEGKNIALRFRA